MADKIIDSKKNAELAAAAHKQQKKNAESAKKSEIKSMMGRTKTIKVAEDTDHPYSLTLRFPGVARAMEIEDMASNQYNNINFGDLMREAIKDVIVSPKITSLDFWNDHARLPEVTIRVLNFLNDGLNGDLK